MTMTLIAKNKLCYVDKSIPQPINESHQNSNAWIFCINMVTTAVENSPSKERASTFTTWVPFSNTCSNPFYWILSLTIDLWMLMIIHIKCLRQTIFSWRPWISTLLHPICLCWLNLIEMLMFFSVVENLLRQLCFLLFRIRNEIRP